jgi:hypothetical protein
MSAKKANKRRPSAIPSAPVRPGTPLFRLVEAVARAVARRLADAATATAKPPMTTARPPRKAQAGDRAKQE